MFSKNADNAVPQTVMIAMMIDSVMLALPNSIISGG